MRDVVTPILEQGEDTRARFAADVRSGLCQRPARIPPDYLYDELGLALFEAICLLPWYRITRAETALIEQHAARLLPRGGAVSRIVELGSGSGEKLGALLAAVRPAPGSLDVRLVDGSAAALARSRRTLEALEGLAVTTHQARYERGLRDAAGEPTPGRTLVLFLGSNLGNFDPPARTGLLGELRQALAPGDSLLLGVDLVKAEADLLLAYDDPLGVTAAFNKNVLVRVNRELGGNFRIDGFSHRALWQPAESRIEMHLVSRVRQHVTVAAAGVDRVFEPGETIWTESSYKFTGAAVLAELADAGFRPISQWVDAAAGVALTLAEADGR